MIQQHKTCLVTGGAGFIGSHLVEALLAEGHTVRVLDNLSSGHLRNMAGFMKDIEFFKGDILDRDCIRKASPGVDVIYHLAAIPSVNVSVKDPLLSHDVNVTGAINLLEQARELEAQFIVASSAAVYGIHEANNTKTPVPESTELKPISPYGLAKYMIEQYCDIYSKLYDTRCTALRFFNVFGPRQDGHSEYAGVIAKFLDCIDTGKTPTIYGDGQHSRDFVYVDDIVQALVLAMNGNLRGYNAYNVGRGESQTIKHTLESIQKVLNHPYMAVHLPERRADIRHSIADISAIHRDLGYTPKVTFEEGLRHFIESNLLLLAS